MPSAVSEPMISYQIGWESSSRSKLNAHNHGHDATGYSSNHPKPDPFPRGGWSEGQGVAAGLGHFGFLSSRHATRCLSPVCFFFVGATGTSSVLRIGRPHVVSPVEAAASDLTASWSPAPFNLSNCRMPCPLNGRCWLVTISQGISQTCACGGGVLVPVRGARGGGWRVHAGFQQGVLAAYRSL